MQRTLRGFELMKFAACATGGGVFASSRPNRFQSRAASARGSSEVSTMSDFSTIRGLKPRG
jgi:hypothetical protein